MTDPRDEELFADGPADQRMQPLEIAEHPDEIEDRLMLLLANLEANGALAPVALNAGTLDTGTVEAFAEDGTDETADLPALAAALRSYRAASLDWAEKRSAAMPSPLPPNARAQQPAWLKAPQWVLGTAALCLCVIGGALYTHHQSALADDAAMALPGAPTQQALAVDNALLSTVDDALRGSVAPGERELGLTASDLLEESAPTRRHIQPE